MKTTICHCGAHAFANTATNAGTVLVDANDAVFLINRTWGARRRRKTFYARSDVDGRGISLHQAIGCLRHDHKNRNGLDNRRCNLRPASSSQNAQNRAPSRHSSKYLGVWMENGKWRAAIRKDGKLHHLGRFSVEDHAGRAYDAAALDLYGIDAYLNFSSPGNSGEIANRA